MTKIQIMQIIAGFVGTLGYSVLFNIRGKRLAVSAFGGLLSWSLFVLLSNFVHNEAINYFFVALVMSVYAEIMARLLKTPTTTYITTSLIPLIPGSSLYYTMAYAFESDMERFISKAVDTLKLGAALALGIIVAGTVTTVVFKLINKNK